MVVNRVQVKRPLIILNKLIIIEIEVAAWDRGLFGSWRERGGFHRQLFSNASAVLSLNKIRLMVECSRYPRVLSVVWSTTRQRACLFRWSCAAERRSRGRINRVAES